MEIIFKFLAQHYLWLIIITIFLIFALIGYFIDEKDRKNGISMIDKKDQEKDIHSLAVNGINKSLNTAVTDNAKKQNTMLNQNNSSTTTPPPLYTSTTQNNVITDLSNQNITNNPF